MSEWVENKMKKDHKVIHNFPSWLGWMDSSPNNLENYPAEYKTYWYWTSDITWTIIIHRYMSNSMIHMTMTTTMALKKWSNFCRQWINSDNQCWRMALWEIFKPEKCDIPGMCTNFGKYYVNIISYDVALCYTTVWSQDSGYSSPIGGSHSRRKCSHTFAIWVTRLSCFSHHVTWFYPSFTSHQMWRQQISFALSTINTLTKPAHVERRLWTAWSY